MKGLKYLGDKEKKLLNLIPSKYLYIEHKRFLNADYHHGTTRSVLVYRTHSKNEVTKSKVFSTRYKKAQMFSVSLNIICTVSDIYR